MHSLASKYSFVILQREALKTNASSNFGFKSKALSKWKWAYCDSLGFEDKILPFSRWASYKFGLISIRLL